MSELEELQRLLFGVEKKTLESLNDRVERPESRTADVADVLPEAVRLTYQKDGALVRELREPVSECLEESFRTSPQKYADVLYPIMGPAIRKSITHTLRAFAQQINEMMEHSLSVRGLGWRLQAMRSGVPFGEYVIRQTLQYRVEQAYLISRENGLLIEHIHHESARIKDSDAVSAMFTAIQDFVKESFSPESNSRLETADMGEFTLWAVHGPHALLVCVIRGVPPNSLRAQLSAILERIHFRHGEALKSYIGDTESVEGVEVELTEAIQFQEREQTNKSMKKVWLSLVCVLLCVVFLFGYMFYVISERNDKIARLESNFANTPGIFLSEVGYNNGVYTVRGLRDPLAELPEQIAIGSEVELEDLQMNFEPYRSFDPDIVFLRATNIIAAPESVNVSRTDDGIVLSGVASRDWIDSLNVKIQAEAIGFPVNVENLHLQGLEELEQAVQGATGAEFSFVEGVELLEREIARLNEFSVMMNQIALTATEHQKVVQVSIAGYTDATGLPELNARLTLARAETVRDQLLRAGLNANQVSIADFGRNEIANSIGEGQRKAVVSLRLEDE